MKFRHTHQHHSRGTTLVVYIQGKKVLTIKNIKKMATISIDIEDNDADLQTAIANFKTAYDGLQSSTLAGLPDALAALTTANDALAGFKISFTASVIDGTPAPVTLPTPNPPSDGSQSV